MTEEVKKSKKNEKEASLTAPIRILNEHRTLNELSNSSKIFREFTTSCDKKMTWSALLCPSKEPFNEKAWKIDIEVPRNYPQSPPNIKFATPIFHPNVDPNSGELKMPILEPSEWKDKVTMIAILRALVYLLNNPEVKNEKLVLNQDAAKQFKSGKKGFDKKAQDLAKTQALERPPVPEPRDRKKAGQPSDSKK